MQDFILNFASVLPLEGRSTLRSIKFFLAKAESVLAVRRNIPASRTNPLFSPLSITATCLPCR